jgi:hypothetical protein
MPDRMTVGKVSIWGARRPPLHTFVWAFVLAIIFMGLDEVSKPMMI